MDSTDWRGLLKIGVAEIDNEHLLIMQMIESLRGALRTAGRDGLPADLAQSTLRELLKYIRQHFSTEEALMRDACYPELASHKREHDLFLEHLVDVEKRATTGGSAMISEFLTSLSNWLQHHVLEVDKHLGYFLLERSIIARHPKQESDSPPRTPAP